MIELRSGFNLPPGVFEDDLPGNDKWDEFIDAIEEELVAIGYKGDADLYEIADKVYYQNYETIFDAAYDAVKYWLEEKEDEKEEEEED